LAQTYTNLEIVLIDDGSQDASRTICDDYAAKDGRIKVLHQVNAGIGATRNAGLGMCTGAYITFVDSDDYLYPDAIQTLYDRIRADGSDLVIGNYVRVYEDGTHDAPFHTYSTPILTRDELLRQMTDIDTIPVCPWGKLYSKQVMEGVTYPSVRIGEDMLTFPSVIQRCFRISMENEPLYGYFQRENSLMKGKDDSAKVGDLHATLFMAAHLWNNGCQAAALNWYSTAIKNALTIPNTRVRLCDFHLLFDRKTRKALGKKLDRKSKIAWWCLHIPLTHIVFRRILH